MKKSHNRSIGVIAILLMLGASPLSVTYSFADSEDNQEAMFGEILTEKIVNGKLEVQHYALPDDVTEEDMQRMVSFEGQTSSWAYVNYKAYHSGIILFDGKASKVGENLWEISTNGMINLGERQFDLKLSGKSNGSHALMYETASDENLNYRVVFSGKVSETDEGNIIAISFMNSGLKNPEIGEQTIKSEKSISSNQEFRNSI
jgi:hypothetical protein